MTTKNHKKQRLQKEARERYQNLSEEEKDKRQKKGLWNISTIFWRRKRKSHQYYREHNKNLCDEQKQKLFEYRMNYFITYNK